MGHIAAAYYSASGKSSSDFSQVYFRNVPTAAASIAPTLIRLCPADDHLRRETLKSDVSFFK
jgi:hypothetical protein